MEPTKFAENNFTLKGTNYEGVSDLPVYLDDKYVISCWAVSWIDRIKLLLSGKVWFWCIGSNHPPISLSIDNPFKHGEL